MAKTKEITIGEQKFTLQSVSPSWYYDFNDECGNTGSGKRKSAKYMDGMFKKTGHVNVAMPVLQRAWSTLTTTKT